ncbi:MAG: lanthionine synthetase LanC family protein [Planctomycetota bacterium]|jgi:lantibiotic modifying enzyme
MRRAPLVLVLLLVPAHGDDALVAHAEKVGERLLAMGRKTEAGMTFGKGPAVYDGDAGVALLFAGLYRATREKRWLEATRATLDQALAGEIEGGGLYTGRAGVGEACLEAYWATGDERFLRDARRCAKEIGKYAATDIIFGAAGAGIFLLNLHRATGDKAHLDAARKAGEYLASTAVRQEAAAHWPIVPGKNPKVYLGFSHGAAGVGYFLLHLWKRTGEKRYRELAEGAARYVLEHEEDGHWWRTVPPSSDFRRIQWCHGAPGIGLFFHDLTRDIDAKPYEAALQRCLETTRRLGRTARKSGCQCHGVAGNAELFLEVYAARKEKRWLEEARRSGRVLAEDHAGAAGYDASYMVGLAGIGHFFLRLADPAGTPLPMMVRR